ncbi:hypothetical protein ACFPOH_06150 [Ureibacillus suwonensis]|uniref:Branched-chain amino acid ABC transporter substrate-binding protein n=1 Tax=Ureibacillus suwonensis TaxID=313007 RepID=A0ABW0RAE1_9BACL
MKKIGDERLKLQNLKNIRIVYFIQTFGIICILGYDWVTKGFDAMWDNPLWMLFMLTTVISAYLSMGIAADYESTEMNPKKQMMISMVVLVFISLGLGIATALTDGYNFLDGILIGGIILICGIFPIVYLYNLRKKRLDGTQEE